MQLGKYARFNSAGNASEMWILTTEGNGGKGKVREAIQRSASRLPGPEPE
ncbi:hypothetical protein THTE_1359 [Thermogutta terrifontis]|uniref:Uncharacterized protein n=1 Tax=Thermogutta terrifontis TaxID=1331910 RepID=A0A286RDC5_9BACT|nr:hypothetical protein THTE_1359 [Thermogutta terrifontis]